MQFKDIVGQRDLINRLTEIIDSGRISHAQMLLGKSGYGSLAIALAYAQYLNCEHREHYAEGDELRADSCGRCPSCLKYQQLVHTDLHLFIPTTTGSKSASSNSPSAADYREDFRKFVLENQGYGSLNDWYAYIGAENKMGAIYVRDANAMVEALSMKANEGGWKVVIVWMAERMRADAANKLLKTLEEPYPRTLILLICEDVDSLLSTILSRTQLIRVNRVDDASMKSYLENFPGGQVDESIIQAAGGDVLMAQRIIRQHDQEVRFAQLFVKWMRNLFKLNMTQLVPIVDEMAAMGREQQKAFLDYAAATISACLLKSTAGTTLRYQLRFDDEKFAMSFPYMVTPNNVERLASGLSEASYAIERNAYAKVTFMELSFRISKALKKR